MVVEEDIELDRVRRAAERIRGEVLRTPLVPLTTADAGPGDAPRVHLKLENLQPLGSFKLRGVLNALHEAPSDRLGHGVCTVSAGNMAQALALAARRRRMPCRVLVPEHAPHTKVAAIERLGGEVLRVPFERWWAAMEGEPHPALRGHLLHPVCEPAMMAGHGTIALEILEDLPEVDTVLVPFGGGGLAVGVASVMRQLAPRVRVLACEIETAAPLRAALDAGGPVTIPYRASFVDGIGGRSVLPAMWPLVSRYVGGSLVVSVPPVREALLRLIRDARVVVEGAGAVPVAAALGRDGRGLGTVACIVSGGNLDAPVLAQLLEGAAP